MKQKTKLAAKESENTLLIKQKGKTEFAKEKLEMNLEYEKKGRRG